MNYQNDNSEIKEVADILLFLSEQMALQSPQTRDNRLISVLFNLGTRLDKIKEY